MGTPTNPATGSATPAFTLRDRVAAAAAGDTAAFAELYDAHAGRVYALCVRLSGDSARATELVQDVFLRVWERLGTFRGESSFGTWLHRVTVNVVLMQARSDTRRRKRVALLDDLGAPQQVARAPRLDPALAIDLDRAIARLPEVGRTVFVLHDIEGYSHDEIATLLDLPVGTSRSHLFRARRQLREELA